jgi:hypothetical protein
MRKLVWAFVGGFVAPWALLFGLALVGDRCATCRGRDW